MTTPKPESSVTVSSWGTGIGAMSSNNTSFDKQKLSFWASVWNNTNNTVYVTSVKVNLPQSLQSHVVSGSTLIAVNRSLPPKATVKIAGQFIVDTKGMTKDEIVNLGNIQGFKVYTKS